MIRAMPAYCHATTTPVSTLPPAAHSRGRGQYFQAAAVSSRGASAASTSSAALTNARLRSDRMEAADRSTPFRQPSKLFLGRVDLGLVAVELRTTSNGECRRVTR